MKEINKKATCILLIGENEYLNKCAILFAEQKLDLIAVVRSKDTFIKEENLAELKPDYVFSFLSDRILKGPLLEFKNVNFHPAPPEWPGRGSASLAIYHSSVSYGATAHIMTVNIDDGPILSVKRFGILPDESCESLFSRGENACLELFYEIVTHIVIHNALPEPSGEQWKRKAMTRKQFEKWLILNPDDRDDFVRKIKATRHSKYPGPYILIHGYKFALTQ